MLNIGLSLVGIISFILSLYNISVVHTVIYENVQAPEYILNGYVIAMATPPIILSVLVLILIALVTSKNIGDSRK